MNLKQQIADIIGAPIPFADDKSPEGRRNYEFFAKDRERRAELEALRGNLPDEMINQALANGQTAYDLWMQVADRVETVTNKSHDQALMEQGMKMAAKLRRDESHV